MGDNGWSKDFQNPAFAQVVSFAKGGNGGAETGGAASLSLSRAMTTSPTKKSVNDVHPLVHFPPVRK